MKETKSVKIGLNLWATLLPVFFGASSLLAQPSTLLRPAAVFDGEEMHAGWVVLVQGDKIAAAGSSAEISAPSDARTIDLPG